MKKSTRKEIAKDTLRILNQGYYDLPNGRSILVAKDQKQAVDQTHLYRPKELAELLNQTPIPRYDTTTFEVNALSTLDSVRAEYANDPNLLCLNFASARNPGGGFLNGSQAQEESIARASGLYPCQLKAEAYYLANRAINTCLYTDHMIYSPAVPILKDEEGQLMDPYVCSAIITAPAVNAGVVLRNEPGNISKIEPVMARRINQVLAISWERGHETLVLGAWGCGVFRNDPDVVAALFQEQLMGRYHRVFKKVVFSVYSKNPRFITPFQTCFAS